jgi:serine phosphatase RsbU (regulator of sigma subunit)/anti-sigma regulatory factor (Ser/Thr protein kinase)
MWAVTEQAVSAEGADEARYGLLTRSFFLRYGVAVISSLSALVLARLILPVAEAPVYSLLVGAVVVAVWYGGFGPGLLALAIGWAIGPFLLASGSQSGLHTRDDLLRWAIPLGVALMVVWISLVMRRAQHRAATAAVAAEESSREMESLQRLTTALSAAVTQQDVAHALVDQTPPLIGALGGSVGLVDGDELVIVDPSDVASQWQTHRPGLRLSLRARAPIARAAAEDELVVVRSREEFATRFADGAAMTPSAHAAVAVPLRIAGDVVGSMSFLYGRDSVVAEEAVAIAVIAADLGGQALERALLYEREHQSRQTLDRILRVAPRFHADTAEEAVAAICREARVTFGSDLAEIWRIEREELELVWREPHDVMHDAPLTEPLELDALPGLRQAVDHLEVSFVADAEEHLTGPLLHHARRLGTRSWLWAPIVAGGQAERALLVSWHTVVSEPDASTFVLARRFADQAGLALEQIDRLQAQAEAAQRAERMRRLQRVTAALSQAATPADVSETCLEHAMAAVGADGGIVGFVRPTSEQVELTAARGYTDDELERWHMLPLAAQLPLCASIASGEPVWALADDARDRFATGDLHPSKSDHRGWVALPLNVGTGVRGAFQLAFVEPHELSEEDREWLQALASQCAQAFDRSRLLDEERRLRRRSERLHSMTAALSVSVTQLDVASVAVSEIIAAVDASAGALAVVADERRQLATVTASGYDDGEARRWLDVAADASTPANRAIKRRVQILYETVGEMAAEFPETVEALVDTGHESFLFVPLVVGGKANGVLVTSWAERTTLTDEERSFVQTLASQAAQALERARHFESERTIAETLQRSVLPASLPTVDGVQLAARYLPGTEEVDVGGDWFDAISLPNGRLGLVVGDVVGKGVQSAATMAQLRNALRAFALDQMKPSSTMTRLNRLADGVSESAFATVVYAVIDLDARVCRFTSAGHPPPLAVYPDGRAEYLEGGRGLPLGTAPETTYAQDVVELPVGTTLILYTDGLIERRDQTIDDGLRQLHAAALTGPRDPERLVDHILHTLVGAGERRDDIAILAVRVLVTAPEKLRLRLPSEIESLDVVRDALRVWLERAPLTQAEAGEIVLAAWEACANAVEHAQRSVDGFFTFTAELGELAVRVAVRDSGNWTPETARNDRGLGLRLMRSLMSSVDIATGDEGTTVLLEKEIASPVELASP